MSEMVTTTIFEPKFHIPSNVETHCEGCGTLGIVMKGPYLGALVVQCRDCNGSGKIDIGWLAEFLDPQQPFELVGG